MVYSFAGTERYFIVDTWEGNEINNKHSLEIENNKNDLRLVSFIGRTLDPYARSFLGKILGIF